MTVLRSREIAPPKTTPHGPKTRPKSDPSTPAETPESVTTTTTTPPPLNSTPSSQSQNPNSNPNPNPNPNPKATDSGCATRLLRRRSLRLASKTPEGSAKRNTQIDEVGFDLFGERVTVMGVEKGAEELKLGSGLDPVTRLSGKGSGFGEEEKVGVDEGLTELGLSYDLGVLGGNSEEKKKRKLDIDINLPAWECEEEDGGSKPFLSLRSGKRVAKPGVDGVGNGECGIDLSADKSGGVKSKGECGRGERGEGKLGENRIDVVVLDSDSDSEVERSGENVFQSDLPSGGSSTGKRKLGDAIEVVVEDSEDEMSSGENGVIEGRRKYSRQEKGKEKLVGGALLPNDDDKVELGLGLEVLGSLHNVVPSPTQIRENIALQDEMQARNSNIRDNGRDRNQYMERFRDIARQNASRFARFDPREEEENDMPPQVDVEQDVEDWPGPFSTAMRIMRDGAEKNMQEQSAYKGKTKPALVNWVPKCQEQDRPISKNLIPSLQELCLSVLAKNADAIVSLESVPDALRHQLSHLLCDSRRMNTHFFELLVQGSPTEVRLRDCSWLTEEEFTKSFQQCDISNLTVLQLDQCGRCLPDYILNSTLARSSNCLPSLTSLSLSGACRLSDVGLGALISSAPALRSLNLSQCSLLTSSSIDALANSLGSVLRELYLNDCQSINAMLILPALEKFEHLEVLWLPGIENVCDDFIKKFITARGHNLKELILTDCINLTDSSVKVIAETCSGLCALDLVNLDKLTDCTLGYLANGCRAIQTLKFCHNSFSDEAIAAFLETSGVCLKELSLNNIKKVGDNTAISLAKHSRSLHSLDLSWCRNLTDEALGLIVDSCLSLKMLKLFGCTQITDLFLCGHSNPEVKIIGVRMTPILKDVKVPDPAAAEEHTYIIHPMALPDREITQLALDVEQSPSTVAARTAYLRTGGNQSSATRTMSTRHESSAEDLNLDYYLPLYHAAFRGNWEDARRFLEHDPNAVKAKISNLSMTALHVAACEGHSEFVEKIVKHMPADELAELDEMGFTALHYAAIGGNLRSAKALLKENPKLAQSVDTKGRTPLHLAASFASECKELVWYLLLVTTDEEPGHPFTGPWASNLMNVLIASGFHDIALYLLQQHPNLATATDQEDCTPLYILAKNQSNFLSGSRLGFWESCIYSFIPIDVDYRPPNSMRAYVGSHHESIQNLNRMPSPVQNGALYWLRRLLCGALKQIAPSGFMTLQDAKLRHHCAVELVKQICIELSRSHMSWRLNYLLNSEILYTATLNGITEIISSLLEFFPDLIWARLRNNQYLLLPFAIELRHEKVFRLVCDHTARSKLVASTLLESGTILHLAAKLAPPAQLTSVCGAALQMQRELQWFKVVENLVHPYYKQSKNGDEKTAKELFTKEHENLAENGEKWLKDTSNSCMVVATLIATVVFAAAFTVPGGNDGADGNPNFLMKKPFIFMVFLVSDAVALFSSLTSVLMFLSILTARYAEEDFIDSLPKRLIIGLASLFFAIAATMVAFGATISIVLSKRFSWVSIPITLLASFPVTLFALLQLPLFIQMVRSTFGNMHHLSSLKLTSRS